MKYIDDRGTEFELYEDGELTVRHSESYYSDKKVINTFKGVKELK